MHGTTLTSQDLALCELNPLELWKVSVYNTMDHYRALDALEVRRHPKLILLEFADSPRNSSSDVLATLCAFGIQNDKKVRDETFQKVWDTSQALFKALPEPEKFFWARSGPLYCLEGNLFSQYDGHTHCIVELPNYNTRYSLQSYRGIASWYITKWDGQQKFYSSEPESGTLKIMFHPLYNSMVVPLSWRIFSSLESLSALTWKEQHKDCRQHHFRVNVYLTDRYFEGPNAKYTTHRVCGDTYVSDLFQVFSGHTKTTEAIEGPKNWQGLRQILWDEGFEHTIDGTCLVRFGPLHSFGAVKESRIMIKDTMWFDHHDYVWLWPCMKDPRYWAKFKG